MTGQPEHAAIPVRLPDPRPGEHLAGRVAVVTGGGRGLGLAIACRLADAGAAVVIAGRHRDTLQSARLTLLDRGAQVAVLECDIADPVAAADLLVRAGTPFGHPNVLVNNAGAAVRGQPGELTPDQFDRLFATNVAGVYHATVAAGETFASGGSVINVSSVVAHVVDPELVAYGATKAAVESLTRSLAVCYGPRGIRINAVAPGYTESPLNASRRADPARSAQITERTPLGQWGLPVHIADAVCFLASEQAAFVTAQVLTVDGGFRYGCPAAMAFAEGGGRRAPP